MTLRVLVLSTLFPDMSRPNFGIFVERQTRELASRPEVKVTVVAPIGMPPWPLSRAARYGQLRHVKDHENWQGLQIYRPRFTTLPGMGGRNVGAMARAILPLVRRLHAERPFDVIDASFFYPDGPVAQRLSKALGIPYSVKARGADIHHWGRRKATRAKVLSAGLQAGGLLAVSGAMKSSMVAMGMDADRITVHYTGVDLTSFAPGDRDALKAELGLHGPVVLCVGALIPRKGQELLIRALPELPGVQLMLLGQGPERRNYEALAAKLGVADRVGVPGAIPHANLPKFFAAADVMALPSASEGLANAWVEALACGTPIVITDVGGARELIDRPEAGLIVERTSQALVAGIRQVLANPPEPEKVRGAAERFTWAANGETLEAHLRAVAGKPAAAKAS